MARTCFVHIGASKTGTSALQRGLFDSVEQLAEQSVGVPFVGRRPHVDRLLRPLGWRTARGFAADPNPARLRPAGTALKRTAGERLLVTCEDMCEADTHRIELWAELFDAQGLQPRVVLSVRNLASVIPSEWQQFLKHRLPLAYPDFLERVREHDGRWADHFWQRQDAIAICRRWGDVIGLDNIDVVVTPPRSRDPHALYGLFGQVIGFDPDRLAWPERDVNASWGYVEAEVYRRVNLTLGDRLPHYEKAYQPTVRWPFVKGVLPRRASARIPLPPEHLSWVVEVAEQQVEWLSTHVRVHGEVADLVPGADAAAPLPELSEADVADAAVETLANFAVQTYRELRRPRAR
ncbi:hypothetical protein [Nocardioides sp.]|uniref:hypothetical protein n=1 Tax=Nocardioides sp. TaxID=35761 RepID=UPI002ED0CAD1